ncbi:decarboxylating NADP(+)-dependent phosphogluconate dehydrogenase [Chitinivibrio alkaliphilus]|uniref:6-phosphogluconate dehydrogenase, decarboxylating n=1 Tax=Chitinivibrio alkaliphilus ACht1 TaxID=1313304 RepID=U7DAG0_9BACT|nr:decarboxylating NADP(+)-dependent phosphogluconate dehydrogenase [Chitinivibrio alkaliphilus]ERP39017.1 6-phosphogluconate dehydrogenase [Chitinivibrio alkaliphilus ACht1]
MEKNELYDIAVIGLAVMGQNLILNMADHGYRVVAFNRSREKVESFIDGPAKGYDAIYGARSLEDVFARLARPARILLMVRAGDAVDALIEQLQPWLQNGDVVIDGGNANYEDTVRRERTLSEAGIHFMGVGISGGEEGARRGPSIMPGGDLAGWPHVEDLFKTISATAHDGAPCCEWVGASGAGHFVKMVHNGIEYGDMQLITEAYLLLKYGLGKSNEEMADIFEEWNTGELDSYLIDITADILRYSTDEGPLIDTILDAAGQKGTGKWTLMNGANMGVPLTLIGEAVFARSLSARVEERHVAEEAYGVPGTANLRGQISVEDIRRALFSAKVISYAQGFMLINTANVETGWGIDQSTVALIWRGGCIIRSVFLDDISRAVGQNHQPKSLLTAPYFRDILREYHGAWRRVAAAALQSELPIPAFASALTFFDGYRRTRGGAELIQAQRDYFGAHTYERRDRPRGEFFHTDWTGHGGATASSSYSV